MHISNSPVWHIKLITRHRRTGIRLHNSYMVGLLVNVVLHGKNAQSKTALQISMQKGLPDDNEEFQVACMEVEPSLATGSSAIIFFGSHHCTN